MNIDRRTKCCNVLQFVQKNDILLGYLWRYKGGHCDLNGRTVANCRGGSRKTAQATIHCATAFTRGEDTSVQDGRHVVGQIRRFDQVHRSAEVPEIRGTLDNYKLASLPAAPRFSSVSFQPSDGNHVGCCLHVILPHDRIVAQVLQVHAIGSNARLFCAESEAQ